MQEEEKNHKTHYLVDEFAGEIKIEGPEYGQDLSYKWIQKHEALQTIEKGIPLKNYLEQFPKRALEEEFQLLKKMTESKNHKKYLKEFDKDHMKLNRYNDIVPYTHSEVKVPLEYETEDPFDSYINADYINSSFGQDRAFICTQGPLPITRNNFWRMIWHDKASLIIMLTKLKENKRQKCDEYWPLEEEAVMELNGFQLRNQGITHITNNLIKTDIELKNVLENTTRLVTHIQCISWPDHGIPEPSERTLIDDLLFAMKEAKRANSQDKIVIHCSAGIGRTGTVLSIFNLVSSIEAAIEHNQDPRISVFGTVRRLREQRFSMVQTLEQYQFIYTYLSYWIKQNLPQKLYQ